MCQNFLFSKYSYIESMNIPHRQQAGYRSVVFYRNAFSFVFEAQHSPSYCQPVWWYLVRIQQAVYFPQLFVNGNHQIFWSSRFELYWVPEFSIGHFILLISFNSLNGRTKYACCEQSAIWFSSYNDPASFPLLLVLAPYLSPKHLTFIVIWR